MNIEVNKVKIFVTVPTENTQEVRNAVCNAGAGIIGEYSYCSTCVKSLGTFIPNDNAKPYIGENNKLEYVEEDELEVIPIAFKVAGPAIPSTVNPFFL